MSATGWTDPDGRPLTFRWQFGDGTGASGASVSHAYSGGGTFSVALTADDGRGTATTTTLTVHAPTAPVPGTIAGPTEAVIGTAVTFTSVAASDPDGRPLTFSWNFGDGTTVSGQSATHTYVAPGTFSVTLMVDNGRANATATSTITIRPTSPPVAGVIDGPTTAEVGALLTFSSHGASDPDGRPLTFSWSFGDGGSASGQSVTHAFARTGTFVVTLTVDDGKATAAVMSTIIVQASPKIVAGSISTTAAIVGIVVTLTSQGAHDADGRPLTYSWDFGDGGMASAPSVTHIYNSSGSYNVVVTVSDGVDSASARATVVVRDLTGRWLGTIPPMPPSIAFSTDAILTQSGSSITGVLPDQGFSPGTINGSIDPATGQITLFVSMGPVILFRFTGSASSDLNTLSGVVNGDGFINTPWTMRRQ